MNNYRYESKNFRVVGSGYGVTDCGAYHLFSGFIMVDPGARPWCLHWCYYIPHGFI